MWQIRLVAAPIALKLVTCKSRLDSFMNRRGKTLKETDPQRRVF